MAFSPLRSKALHHGRSLSLPSKLNLAPPHFEEILSNVRSSEAVTSSLSSMKDGLSNLKTLYKNMDDLLVLPHIQQIISSESQEKWVDQVLDGCIRLMDSCTTAKDVLSQTKQGVQELLSALRRKDADGVRAYLSSRRNLKKAILESFRDLRSFKSSKQSILASSLEKNKETMVLVYMLKETESATITVLESLLSCLNGGTKVQAMQSGWSLVAKMMKSKKMSGDPTDVNEFEKMESLLHMNMEYMQVEEIMSCLKDMDLSIQNLEEELECLFRQLIKNRVFLLNILNH